MAKKYKISELIMNSEKIFLKEEPELNNYKKVRKIKVGNKTKYLTWVDDKNMKSIMTPEGRELTHEELFDFIIGNNITDLARSKNIEQNRADIAIVLGNGELEVTKQRAIKAFELYKLGIVKKIIFTGGIAIQRDKKRIMRPQNLNEFMDNSETKFDWTNLPEADWGAETFIPGINYKDYEKHKIKLTEDFLRNIGVKPEDILTEGLSTSTQENAEFCKNAFEIEEIETGTKIKSAIIVTTITHGSRAIKQFRKVFGNKIRFTWCPSTLDLEKYGKLKKILRNPTFNEKEFKEELKRVYCTTPELIKKLMEETANHRNAFILGDIEEPMILTNDREEQNIEI